MQNGMRDRLIELINQDNCPSPYICDERCKYSRLEQCIGDRLADHLIANGVILPPCKVGETLYLVQVDYKGNYNFSNCLVDSKITMFSILRAYEEKTIVYMSTDKSKAEQKLKEMRNENGKL